MDIGAVWTGTNTSIAKYQHSNDTITGQMGRLGPLYSPYRRSRYVSASTVMEIRPTSLDVPLLLWDGYGLLYGEGDIGFLLPLNSGVITFYGRTGTRDDSYKNIKVSLIRQRDRAPT